MLVGFRCVCVDVCLLDDVLWDYLGVRSDFGLLFLCTCCFRGGSNSGVLW